MPSGCEDLYRIDLPNNFYSNINFGPDIYLDKTLAIILGFKYQLFKPTINYEKPNCAGSFVTSHSKFTEKVNLNIFLWNVGAMINF